MKEFIEGRFKGAIYAFKGAVRLLKTEASIQVQFSIGVLITIMGFYFNISSIEWIAQTFAIGMVLGVEGLNTAIEEICDFVHPDFHKKIGVIKDIAAGSVFFVAIVSIIIGIIIYQDKITLAV